MSGTLMTRIARSINSGANRLAGLGHRYRRNEQGNVAIVVAIALVPLMAAVGGAMDFSRANGVQTEFQNAADAAALAARLDASQTPAGRMQAARNALRANLGDSYTAYQVHAQIHADDDVAQVTLTGRMPTTLLGIVGLKTLDVRAHAEARGRMLPVCFLALNPTAAGAISANGISELSARDCRVHVNSSNSRAVNLVGGASITSASNCFVGGVGQGLSRISPAPEAECAPMADPFADLALPASGACDHSGLFTVSGSGTHHVSPGRYCGGIEISQASRVVFQPGIYIIEGQFSVGGSAIEGDGVSFILRGANAGLDWAGDGRYRLSAPRSGAMATMLIHLDPAATNAADASRMAGSTDTYYEGNIYLPGQTLTLVGNGTTQGASPYTVMVADRFDLRGNTTMSVDPASQMQVSDGLYSGQVALTR